MVKKKELMVDTTTTVIPVLTDHCHERPPVLTDHISVANGVVFQDRFYCINYT